MELTLKKSATVVVAKATVEDATSPIKEAAYAVDSGEWRILFPSDRIFDSKTEEIRFEVRGLVRGEHTVVLKAADTLGNIGVAKALVEIP